MFDRLDMLMISAKNHWLRLEDRLLHEERGAADIVAILVVIVILLAVAAVFKGALMNLVNSVFNKASSWVDSQNTN